VGCFSPNLTSLKAVAPHPFFVVVPLNPSPFLLFRLLDQGTYGDIEFFPYFCKSFMRECRLFFRDGRGVTSFPNSLRGYSNGGHG